MSRKTDLITDLYRQTVKTVTKSERDWMAFLRTAAWQYRMKNRNIRYQVAIDQNAAAMKLIEILLAKGMINQATYTNIVKHSNLHISQVV